MDAQVIPLTLPIVASLLVGAALALRFRFIILLPVTIVVLLVSFLVFVAMGYGVWPIALSLILEATALQIGYVGGSLLLPCYRRKFRRMRQRRAPTKPQ